LLSSVVVCSSRLRFSSSAHQQSSCSSGGIARCLVVELRESWSGELAVDVVSIVVGMAGFSPEVAGRDAGLDFRVSTLKREKRVALSLGTPQPTLPDLDTSTRLLPPRRNIQDSI
jgi:hypothetical protein